MNAQEAFIKEYGQLKFVRIGEEYRFCQFSQEHSSLISEEEKLKVVSAGFVFFDTDRDQKKFVFMGEMKSFGLQIGPVPDDGENISKLTGFYLFKKG